MRYFIVFVLFQICITLDGASLPSEVSVSEPKFLLKNHIKESETEALINSPNWGQSNKSDKFWCVYSDRKNNLTYNAPHFASGQYDKLDFNEPLRIAKIENGFAHVYVEKQKGIEYPYISSSAVSKGWVPMKNLLLWGSCPTNEAGIYNKALIMINLDEIKAGSNKDLGKRYLNPATREGEKELVSSMNFYFVMKKDVANGLVLLAKDCKMGGDISQVLYGWVSTNSYISMNYCIFLEPNWKPTVVEQMVGQRVPVFKKSSKSIKLCEIPLGRKNLVSFTPTTMYRMNPQEMRYSLMINDSKNDNIYKVIAFARPDGSAAHVSNDTVFIDGDIRVIDSRPSTIVAFQGYVEKRNSEGLDFWEPVILISSDELATLMDKLQPVMIAANSGSIDRKPYIEATKYIINMIRQNDSNNENEEIDIKKISKELGISLNTRTPVQIQDIKTVPLAEFDYMISEFRNKFNKLKKIREQKYDFSFTYNKTTWYWIPLEDIPIIYTE